MKTALDHPLEHRQTLRVDRLGSLGWAGKSGPEAGKKPPGFEKTILGSENTRLGFGKTFQGFRETMQGSEKNLLGFGKTRRLFRGLGLGLADSLLGFGRRLPGGRNLRRDVGIVLPGSGDSLQEVAFSCPPFETQAFHSRNGLTADGQKKGSLGGAALLFRSAG